MKCAHCGWSIIQVGGEAEFVCTNPACPGLFVQVKCPQCNSPEKFIQVVALGHQEFVCKVCQHAWSSLSM
jgi:hypothetical protein